MSQPATETAPTTTEPQTTAPPAEVAATEAAPATPAVNPRDDLKAAIEAHKAALGMTGKKDEEPPPAEPEKPDEAAAPAETKEEPKTDAQPAQDAAQATPAAPVEPDSPPDIIARYLKQERAARAAKKQAEEAAAAAKAEQEAARAARETAEKARQATDELMALAKSNPQAAVRKLLGDATLRDSTVLYDLITSLDDKNGTAAPTQTEEERVAALVAREIETRKAAEQREAEAARVKAEQQRQAENKANREIYFSGLAEEFKANAAKYPFLAAEAVSTAEMDTWIGQQFNANHVLPSPDAIFAHFDGVQKKRAERLAAALHKTGGPTPPVTPQQKPSPNTALKVTVDSRGKAPTRTDERKSFRDEREEIMQRLERTRA